MKVSDHIEYFKQCAVNHVDLLHDDVDNIHFSSLSYDELLSSLRTKVKSPYLLLENSEGTLDDSSNSDNVRDIIRGAFMIMGQLKKKGDYDEQRFLLDKCKQIAFDIVAKMWNDRKKNVLSGFSPSSIVYQMVGPLWDNNFGYRVEYTFNVPAKIGFDATRWTNETIHK